MKQWKLWLGAIAVAAVQQLVLPLPAVEAGPVLFTVCGQSASGDRNAALQDAQKRAVRKALLQYLNVDSPKFQELSGRYREFVASPQVFEKKKQGEKLMLFSKVSVDMDALHNELVRNNTAKQARHEDHNACFLVRVSGLANETADGSGQVRALKTYSDAFERLGFQPSDEDALISEMRQYRDKPYDVLWPQLRDDICTKYENVQLAVIGEIIVGAGPQDGNGVSRAGKVRLKAIDLQTKQVIASAEDSYEVRRDSAAEADQFIVDKAAVNSARALADQTAAYWQNH